MTQINKIDDMFQDSQVSFTPDKYLEGELPPELEDESQLTLLEDFGELKIYCYPDPQYGLYRIKYSKGKTPEYLKKNRFTSILEARRLLKSYLHNNPVRLNQAKNKPVRDTRKTAK